MAHQTGIKVIAQNRKAFHDYFVDERYECGIALFGTEVKSIRQGRVNLKESWAQIRHGEVWVEGMHISPYEQGNQFNRDPLRSKKLLMHKSEIRKLGSDVDRQAVRCACLCKRDRRVCRVLLRKDPRILRRKRLSGRDDELRRAEP